MKKIPQTDSIEELVRFWDSHDLTDFEDELEEVGETVFERETVIKLRLTKEQAEAVRKIAEERGVNAEHLVREWVLEKVNSTDTSSKADS